MLYHAYELTHAAISPMRTMAQLTQRVIDHPSNALYANFGSRTTSAALEMFVNATRRYGKPSFDIFQTSIDGADVPVVEEIVLSLPFCNLIHFRKDGDAVRNRRDPAVLIVAPMSGHYATLLRGTVEAMLPEHDVYVTDWIDARDVPLAKGTFDLDDYTDYVIAMIERLSTDGRRVAVMAVCQPGIPVVAAASLMAMKGNGKRPSAIVLMGSPMDTARNPKQPNLLATQRPLSWFENNVVVTVPWPNRGFLRRVYPGFLQLSSFLAMNADRHVDAHIAQFKKLVRGDGDSSEAHRRFYNEYLAVMDLTADFYLQTIERVFQKRLMAVGQYAYRNALIEPGAITDIGLMTIEGENDDITGLGQTEAAHDIVGNLRDDKRLHYAAAGVGHYGVFNGSKWRTMIQPKVRDFIRAQSC